MQVNEPSTKNVRAAHARGTSASSKQPKHAAKTASIKAEELKSKGKVAALEGIRALSILAIVLYHADPSWLPGGFFGVSVFFVLTGYLTTLSLERELDSSGRLDYPRFLKRRLARLVPSVLVLVGFTTILCALFSHSLVPKVKSDALSSLLFFENIHFIISDVPYFAAAGLPSPLTHLWFLGVTMQFYIVWPLVLMLLRKVCRKRRTLFVVVGALIVASAVEMALLFDPSGDTTRVYYGPDTRAAEFLMGALCALMTRGFGWGQRFATRYGKRRRTYIAWGYELLAVASIALLVVMCFTIDGFSPLTYRGGTLVASLLAALLVGVVCRSKKGPVALLLGLKPLVAAGAVSFSIYLWHYPLLLVMNPATRTTELPWWGWVLEFVVIIGVSVASHIVVEKGVGKRWLFGQTSAQAALYLISVVALLVLAVVPVNASQTGVPLSQQTQSSQEPAERNDVVVEEPSAPEQKDDSEAETEKDAEKDSEAGTAEDAGKDSEKDPEKDAEEEQEESSVPKPEDYTVDSKTGATDARVLLVGDSVSLGAEDAFYQIFPDGWMDSAISRQLIVGVDVFNSCVAAGHDAPVVIFALGTNGVGGEDDMRKLVEACGPDRRVLLVNTRLPGATQDRVNGMLAEVASEYDNVELVDWHAASTGHDEYFWDDGTHLRPEGAQAYVMMLRKAVTGR